MLWSDKQLEPGGTRRFDVPDSRDGGSTGW